MSPHLNHRGFTLLEALFAIIIFSLLALSMVWILITGLRTQRVVWDQLSGQNDVRRVLQQVIDDVRRSEPSSAGAYPVAAASSTEFRFYANINNDSFRERVRFWIQDEQLYKGVITPSGSPLTYVEANEVVTVLARNVKNQTLGIPLFTYYGESYTGVEASLPLPIITTDVRLLQIRLTIDVNPISSPVPISAESYVQIRNVKLN